MDEDEAHLAKVGNEWHHLDHNQRNTGYKKGPGMAGLCLQTKNTIFAVPHFALVVEW